MTNIWVKSVNIVYLWHYFSKKQTKKGHNSNIFSSCHFFRFIYFISMACARGRRLVEWGWGGNDDKMLRCYRSLHLSVLLVEGKNVDTTQKVLPEGVPWVKSDGCSPANPFLWGLLSCHISENTESSLDNIFTYADRCSCQEKHALKKSQRGWGLLLFLNRIYVFMVFLACLSYVIRFTYSPHCSLPP